jgi:hypothetical protein
MAVGRLGGASNVRGAVARITRDLYLRELITITVVYDDQSRAVLARQIDEWLGRLQAENSAVEAVDRGEDDQLRWYVRMRGVEREYTTVWLTLGQRTLSYETYVMPAPEENHQRLFEHLLRRNERMVGAHFSIGSEDAVFLRGEIALSCLDEAEFDRIVGSLYEYVERYFRPALQIGFASRFRDGGS